MRANILVKSKFLVKIDENQTSTTAVRSTENVEWSLQVIHDVASRSLGELCVTQRFCSLSVPLDTAKFDPARQKADLAATLLQDLGVGHHNGKQCNATI
ncbi:hypothetical protein QE152_g23617 [Popillia japonica]|uniref:Uncharacterized protein n=1 Tax=Popillia japonica TaxID=7064 RepID=A0AAW1KG90_POPJA